MCDLASRPLDRDAISPTSKNSMLKPQNSIIQTPRPRKLIDLSTLQAQLELMFFATQQKLATQHMTNDILSICWKKGQFRL